MLNLGAARKAGILRLDVWDYPEHRVEFISAFWDAAGSVDHNAEEAALHATPLPLRISLKVFASSL